MIPLNQVTSGAEVVWEDPVVMRRDRFPTLTVHADPRTGLPSQLFNRVRAKIEADRAAAGLFARMGRRVRGFPRRPRRAGQAAARTCWRSWCSSCVCLFNSIRTTLLIWLIMPLAIIGVTAGLLLTGMPFGFMALLGVLALGGELIKNSDRRPEQDSHARSTQGKPPYQAILDGGTSKMRPVCMVVLTTVLGMIPLLEGPVLRRDGGVHHVRPVVRLRADDAGDACAIQHLLRCSRRYNAVALSARTRLG